MGKDHELLEAARVGDTTHVEKLLYPRSKSTVLAATLGFRFGANVNCQDHSGYTPLHHASLNGHTDIVKQLLRVGANCNITDRNKSCPLHLASWNGHSEIVHILLTNGPVFANVNELNADCESALHCASQHGHKETVQILLENHADPTFRNNRDESALDLASQYGRLNVVRLLLTYRPQLLQHSAERFTPLHLASRNGHREVVELLLVHGADINKVGANGTALHEAALFGKAEVVSLLLRRGARPNAKNAKGRTPLELVSQLDTDSSRAIARFIEAQLQDDDDYEAMSPSVTKGQSLEVTGSVKNIPELIDEKGHVSLRENSQDNSLLSSPGRIPRVTSKSFEQSNEDSITLDSGKTSTPIAEKTKLFKISSRSLRRSSSARSSRSLPRLPPSSHHSKSFRFHRPHAHVPIKDTESRIPQHHPSIDMFPVDTPGTPKRENRRSSSLPASPSTQKSVLQMSTPHEDDVFFSFNASPDRRGRESIVTVGYNESYRRTAPSFTTFTPKTPLSAATLKQSEKKSPLKQSIVDKEKTPIKTKDDTQSLKSLTESNHYLLPQENLNQDGIYENLMNDTLEDGPLSEGLYENVAINSNGPPPLPRKLSISVSPTAEEEDRFSPPLPVKEKNKKSAASSPTKPPSHNGVNQLTKALNEESSPVNDSSAEGSPKLSKSPIAPVKPSRGSKLIPPPLPPKPTNEQAKPRPPSPLGPPPEDSDISSDQSSARTSRSSLLSNHSFNSPEAIKSTGVTPVPKPRSRVPHHSPKSSKSNNVILSPTESVSPPFSPPSPNTAMQQVSNALQRVLMLEDGNSSNTYDNLPIVTPQLPLSTSQTVTTDNADTHEKVEQNIKKDSKMPLELSGQNDDENLVKNNENIAKDENNESQKSTDTSLTQAISISPYVVSKSKTLPLKAKNPAQTARYKMIPRLSRKHNSCEDVIYEPARPITSDSKSSLKLQLYDIPFIDDGNTPKNVRRSFSGVYPTEQMNTVKNDEAKRRRRSTSMNHDFETKPNTNPIAHYTPSEVKRARICSTKSITDQPTCEPIKEDIYTFSSKSRSTSDLNQNKEFIALPNKSNTLETPKYSMHHNVDDSCSSTATIVTTQTAKIVPGNISKRGIPPKVPPKHLKPKLILQNVPLAGGKKAVNVTDYSKPSLKKKSLDGSLKQAQLQMLYRENSQSTTSLDTSDDWNDNVSDRTDDVEMPKHVRKYKGLIRGSSLNYRSRFSNACVGSHTLDYDSDEEYYGENNPPFAYERIGSESRKTLVTLEKNKTKVILRQSSADKEKHSFNGEISTSIVTSQSSDHSRSSSYDNNNNNNDNQDNKNSTLNMSAPVLSSPMSEGMPDFTTIVETVAAVRNRSSPHGSTSGMSSTCSSQTSTMPQKVAKQSSVDHSKNESQDEWAQIASTLTSIKSINKDSVYDQEFEETFWKIMTGSDLPRYVSTWLDSLGLPQYNKVLCGNGFDNINFLSSNILEEQDLVDMNIRDSSHRRRMLDSAKDLPKIRDLTQVEVASVPEWMNSIDLPQFSNIFMDMGFNTIEKIKKIKDTEIAALVPLRGHRKRIRSSIQSRSEKQVESTTAPVVKTKSTSPPLPRSPLLDKVNFFKDYSKTTSKIQKNTHGSTSTTDTSGVSSGIGYSTGTTGSSTSACSARSAELKPKTEANTTNIKKTKSKERRSSRRSHRNSATESTSIKTYKIEDKDESFEIPTSEPDSITLAISEINNKARTKSQTEQDKENIMSSTNSNNTSSLAVPDTNRAKYLAESGSKLPLRAPNETTMEVSVTAWGHTSETLINSCCNYQAYYLGSMLVQDVKGVASTVEACSKMKRSTDSMKKIPTITLSISYRGVKFIDSKSNHEIAEHEIQNISFASQDADDLTTFAYITRDARTGNHYCHVFRVTTVDLAFEVILTLGQAFEVAYQLILKEKSTGQLSTT